MPDDILMDNVKTLNSIRDILREWIYRNHERPHAILFHPREFMRIAKEISIQNSPLDLDLITLKFEGVKIVLSSKMPEDGVVILSANELLRLVMAEECLMTNIRPLRGDLHYPHKKILNSNRWIVPEE